MASSQRHRGLVVLWSVSYLKFKVRRQDHSGSSLSLGPGRTTSTRANASWAISGQLLHILARADERPAKNLHGNHHLAKSTMVPFWDLSDVWAVVPAKPSNEVVE